MRYSADDKELYRHSYNAMDLQENVLESMLVGKAGTASFAWDKKGRTRKIAALHFKEKIPEDGYDAVGNLKELTITDHVGTVKGGFSYNDLYHLKKERGVADHSYHSDSLANRLDKDGKRYKLDDHNRITKSDEAEFRYDANGNMIKKYQGEKVTRYAYDALNRLIEVEEEKNFKARYTYDSFNRRQTKTLYSWSDHSDKWREE